MREQIEGSVLLTREGDDYTSLFLTGESLMRDAITHYLLTGETPAPNMVFDNCDRVCPVRWRREHSAPS